MAYSKAVIALFLISFLFMDIVEANEMMDVTEMAASPHPEIAPSPHSRIDCGGACKERCKQASRQKICLRACGTCCSRCNCVPPGTSGNLDVCPCYANMKTHGGRRKCP